MDEKVFDEIAGHVKQMMVDYRDDIVKAYLATEKSFTISFSAKLTPEVDSGTKIVTTIGFTPTNKIKDFMEGVVGKKQQNLAGM